MKYVSVIKGRSEIEFFLNSPKIYNNKLICIMSPPNVGKSDLALNLVASNPDAKILYFLLERNIQDTIYRYISIALFYKAYHMKRLDKLYSTKYLVDLMSEEPLETLSTREKQFYSLVNEFGVDTENLTVFDNQELNKLIVGTKFTLTDIVRQKIGLFLREHKLEKKIIIIDHEGMLQQFQGNGYELYKDFINNFLNEVRKHATVLLISHDNTPQTMPEMMGLGALDFQKQAGFKLSTKTADTVFTITGTKYTYHKEKDEILKVKPLQYSYRSDKCSGTLMLDPFYLYPQSDISYFRGLYCLQDKGVVPTNRFSALPLAYNKNIGIYTMPSSNEYDIRHFRMILKLFDKVL